MLSTLNHGHVFRLSASDFKNVWNHYDRDMNGYIEAEELEAFLRDLFAAQVRKGAFSGPFQSLFWSF